jgi:hypothetical protein
MVVQVQIPLPPESGLRLNRAGNRHGNAANRLPGAANVNLLKSTSTVVFVAHWIVIGFSLASLCCFREPR